MGSNPNPATVRSWDSKIPATPYFAGSSYANALSGNSKKDLSQQASVIGLMRNGAALLSCYGGATYGQCTNWASSAVNHEGAPFYDLFES